MYLFDSFSSTSEMVSHLYWFFHFSWIEIAWMIDQDRIQQQTCNSCYSLSLKKLENAVEAINKESEFTNSPEQHCNAEFGVGCVWYHQNSLGNRRSWLLCFHFCLYLLCSCFTRSSKWIGLSGSGRMCSAKWAHRCETEQLGSFTPGPARWITVCSAEACL